MTSAVEVGRVLACEVGLVSVDLDTREIGMVLGEMHLVAKHKSIASDAPFCQSLAIVGNGDFFRGVYRGEILRHSLEAFLDEFLGLGTFRIGETIDSLAIGVSVFVCHTFGL